MLGRATVAYPNWYSTGEKITWIRITWISSVWCKAQEQHLEDCQQRLYRYLWCFLNWLTREVITPPACTWLHRFSKWFIRFLLLFSEVQLEFRTAADSSQRWPTGWLRLRTVSFSLGQYVQTRCRARNRPKTSPFRGNLLWRDSHDCYTCASSIPSLFVVAYRAPEN